MLRDLIRGHMEATSRCYKLTNELGRTLVELLKPVIPDILEYRTIFDEEGLNLIRFDRKEHKAGIENLGVYLRQIAARHGLTLYVDSHEDAYLSRSEANAVEEIMNNALGGPPERLFEVSVFRKPDGTYVATSSNCVWYFSGTTAEEAVSRLLEALKFHFGIS